MFFGLLAGWLLAVLRQPARRAAWMIVVAGFLYVLLFPVGLWEKGWGLLVETVRLESWIIGLPQATPFDWALFERSFSQFLAAIAVVFDRVQVWLGGLLSGQALFDPVAAAFVWSSLSWLISAWSGWVAIARRNPLLAALPAVLLSLSLLSYARQESFLLYFILGMLLVLVAIMQQHRREQGWMETRVAFPAWKGRHVALVAITASIALVFLSAFVSSLSFQKVQNWIAEWRKPPAQSNPVLAKSLGIQPAVTSAPDTFESVRRPGLPQDHLIGSGPELSKKVVMTIALDNLSALSQVEQHVPVYWRSFVYDIYTGHGWRSSNTQEVTYQANQPLPTDHAANHIQVQQKVYPLENGSGYLYAAGEPVSVDRQSQAAWRSHDDLFGVRLDEERSYTAVSLLPAVSETALRNASPVYPDWVRQRYLALPPNLPERVRELAIELTAAEPTPYDRARAIETYLRSFPYTLDVPFPPTDQDLVSYFLFDLQKGYCDYYASAMVVLARAAGIPARLATGYASGTYNLNSGRFVVTEADGHSWVEIYFPKIGWIPFEPTAGRPILAGTHNPAQEEPQAATPLETQPPEVTQVPLAGLGLFFIGVLAVLALLVVGWIAWDDIRLHRATDQKAAAEVYRLLQSYGALYHMEGEAGETPVEFAFRFQKSILEGSGLSYGLSLAPQFRSFADDLIRTLYRPTPLGVSQDLLMTREWKSLRWKLRKLWILSRADAIRERAYRLLKLPFASSANPIEREE